MRQSSSMHDVYISTCHAHCCVKCHDALHTCLPAAGCCLFLTAVPASAVFCPIPSVNERFVCLAWFGLAASSSHPSFGLSLR